MEKLRAIRTDLEQGRVDPRDVTREALLRQVQGFLNTTFPVVSSDFETTETIPLVNQFMQEVVTPMAQALANTPSQETPEAVPLDPTTTTTTTTTETDLDETQMSAAEDPTNTRSTLYYRDFTKPWKRHPDRGAYTNADRPKYPRVFRPYGSNTRERVVGFRKYTRMHHLGYDAEVVESRSVPPLLSPQAALGQSGAPSITSRIPALRPGSHHCLFATRRG